MAKFMICRDDPPKYTSSAKNLPTYTTAYTVQQSNFRWQCEPTCSSSFKLPHHLRGGCSQGFSSSNRWMVGGSQERGECRAGQAVPCLPLQQHTAREGWIYEVDKIQFLSYCTLIYKCFVLNYFTSYSTKLFRCVIMLLLKPPMLFLINKKKMGLNKKNFKKQHPMASNYHKYIMSRAFSILNLYRRTKPAFLGLSKFNFVIYKRPYSWFRKKCLETSNYSQNMKGIKILNHNLFCFCNL